MTSSFKTVAKCPRRVRVDGETTATPEPGRAKNTQAPNFQETAQQMANGVQQR